MGVFDQTARFASQADPQTVSRRVLAKTKAPLAFQEWADTRTLPQPGGTDRTADLVAILADAAVPERPWLLALEFQTRHDPDKLEVTLEEVARLRLHGRHGQERRGKYLVLAGLVYLRGQCPESALDMTLPEGFGTRHTALVWNVEEDSADAAFTAVETGQATWGLLFWVPLMAGAGEPAVIARWKQLASAIADGRRRGNLGMVALVFAELAGRYAAWKTGLEDFDMTESQVVNSWIEEAVTRKELETTQQFLLWLLQKRFPGQVSPEAVQTINAQPSLAMLKDWLDQAYQVASMADFVRILRT
ncbi:MAG TPA: hypothetical protein VEL76_15125 [Gemmataceae bacterium]|nr:hypothetical protein [Gemmataceae bacterium]